MKTEDCTAKEDAEVLRAVRAMRDRGMAPDLAAYVVAVAFHSNEILNDTSWFPAK